MKENFVKNELINFSKLNNNQTILEPKNLNSIIHN